VNRAALGNEKKSPPLGIKKKEVLVQQKLDNNRRRRRVEWKNANKKKGSLFSSQAVAKTGGGRVGGGEHDRLGTRGMSGLRTKGRRKRLARTLGGKNGNWGSGETITRGPGSGCTGKFSRRAPWGG